MLTGFIATLVTGAIVIAIENLNRELRDCKINKFAQITIIFFMALSFFGSAWFFTHFGWWDSPGSNVWNG